MGWMRFAWTERLAAVSPWLAEAYLTGPDGVPWASKLRDEGLAAAWCKPSADSAQLHVPLPVQAEAAPAAGRPWMLSTTTLMETSPADYALAVELMRGTLHRVRQHFHAWSSGGLRVDESWRARLRAVTTLAARATTKSSAESADEAALAALEQLLPLAEDLAAIYAEQGLAARHRQGEKLNLLLGAPLERPNDIGALRRVANTVLAPTVWSQIEPECEQYDFADLEAKVRVAREAGVRVMLGPLASLCKRHTPHWVYLWEDDPEQAEQCLINTVQKVVETFTGRVALWQVAGDVTAWDALGLSDEQALRLIVRTLETVRRIDKRTPTIVSFAQPWGEQLRTVGADLPAWHVADMLVRGGLGLSGVGLQIDLASPGGTWPRDRLAVSEQIDRWTALGLPLVVSVQAADESTLSSRGDAAMAQQETAARMISLLAAKPAVQGIFWATWQDRPGQPAAGLVDEQAQRKPAGDWLAAFRREHLG